MFFFSLLLPIQLYQPGSRWQWDHLVIIIRNCVATPATCGNLAWARDTDHSFFPLIRQLGEKKDSSVSSNNNKLLEASRAQARKSVGTDRVVTVLQGGWGYSCYLNGASTSCRCGMRARSRWPAAPSAQGLVTSSFLISGSCIWVFTAVSCWQTLGKEMEGFFSFPSFCELPKPTTCKLLAAGIQHPRWAICFLRCIMAIWPITSL